MVLKTIFFDKNKTNYYPPPLLPFRLLIEEIGRRTIHRQRDATYTVRLTCIQL